MRLSIPLPSHRFRAARRQRGRALNWLLGLLATLVALALIALVVLLTFDWNRARPWINERVSAATGRHFAIEGDLTARWHWPQPADMETGWRRWVPGLTVQAERMVLGNRADFGRYGAVGMDADNADARVVERRASAASATAPASGVPASPASAPASAASAPEAAGAAGSGPVPPSMATVGRAAASLKLLPLLVRHVSIGTLSIQTPDVALARRADGSNNWTFDRPAPDGSASPNPWTMNVARLVVNDGRLALSDAQKDLAFVAHLATQSQPGPYGVRFDVRGRYAKARIEGSGQAGNVLSLRQQDVQYPLQFKARAGTVRAEVEGTLANPLALAGMDLQVLLQAESMADLYPLTGLVLPNTPPFRTKGHLVGSLEPGRAVWDYRDFTGTVGQSDLRGQLTYTSGQPRPRLKGEMASRQLRLADLGPVVGAPSGERPQEKGTSKRAGKVLPDASFATDRWNAMDLDLTFKGERIVRDESLPIENLDVHARMDNAQLTLSPLRFGVAQGKIDSSVVLDGRDGPLKAQLRGSVDGLRLSALFPKVELMEKSFGRLDGAMAVNGTGNSIAKMLGTSNGEARVYIRDGRFSKQMLDLAALNVGSVVVAKLFGENKEVQLRCAVADFGIKDGIAQTRSVKLNTEEAVVEAMGTLDLGREYMDIYIKPESLKWKFFSLRTPLYVRGTFADPKVGVEAGPLLLRAGAAIAAAAVAPVALALVPVTVPAAEDDENCATLLAHADRNVQAGKAGAAPKPAASAPARPAASAAR
ncbi:AsmA family protein [Acidovorax sp. NCPPB 3859]|nr:MULTISPECIES: AsmA family protein [unclassified Acidovorax]MDA8451402.1 AsmA family protein [Acidovorax sp. GBBC 3297]MDA8460847.1 AsmA family protein [Acidovorax sp. GBBC 3333]MDA8465819.1 AsmA family protein [Acidovorax sp. GBBC 3332]MDA8470917.1 AsmA family protein [Acidovorax sp. GBBC 3299]WCM76517.1 AsmA family protein [Acidovorax sp. GBBC 712]